MSSRRSVREQSPGSQLRSRKPLLSMAESELKFTAGHGRGAGGVVFAKRADSGFCLVTCGADGKVAVRDAATAGVQTSHAAGGPDSNSPLLSIAASPAGGQVATGGQDQFIKARLNLHSQLSRSDSNFSIAAFVLSAASDMMLLVRQWTMRGAHAVAVQWQQLPRIRDKC